MVHKGLETPSKTPSQMLFQPGTCLHFRRHVREKGPDRATLFDLPPRSCWAGGCSGVQGALGRGLDPSVSCISSGITVLLPWHRVSQAGGDARAAASCPMGPQCKSSSQCSQLLLPGVPTGAGKQQGRDMRGTFLLPGGTQGPRLTSCVSSAVASLLFSLSLCSLEASSCKMIPVHSQQLVITHWTFGGERGCSGPPSTWRKRPLLSQEARLRNMELPCLHQDSSPASTCPGC